MYLQRDACSVAPMARLIWPAENEMIFSRNIGDFLTHPLINKKRVSQLIDGKPGENRHKLAHSWELLPNYGATGPPNKHTQHRTTATPKDLGHTN